MIADIDPQSLFNSALAAESRSATCISLREQVCVVRLFLKILHWNGVLRFQGTIERHIEDQFAGSSRAPVIFCRSGKKSFSHRAGFAPASDRPECYPKHINSVNRKIN